MSPDLTGIYTMKLFADQKSPTVIDMMIFAKKFAEHVGEDLSGLLRVMPCFELKNDEETRRKLVDSLMDALKSEGDRGSLESLSRQFEALDAMPGLVFLPRESMGFLGSIMLGTALPVIEHALFTCLTEFCFHNGISMTEAAQAIHVDSCAHKIMFTFKLQKSEGEPQASTSDQTQKQETIH